MDNKYKKDEYSTDNKTEYITLKTKHKTLQEEYTNLQEEYTTLQEEYAKLNTEYTTLKTEYSENVIIQSMDDMKQRYDRLIQSTVPKHKYTLMYEKYSRMVKYFSGCSVLIDHILKSIKKLNRTLLYNQDAKHVINRIETELITTRDILEESMEISFT